MKADNKNTTHNRNIRFTDLPGETDALTVYLNYTNDDAIGRSRKAVCLDNVVIPAIIKAINEQDTNHNPDCLHCPDCGKQTLTLIENTDPDVTGEYKEVRTCDDCGNIVYIVRNHG